MCPAAHRDGFPRLRHWRPGGGGELRGDEAGAGRGDAAAAGRQAAIPDGGGIPQGHRGGGAERRGHVRLRAADPQWPQWICVHGERPAAAAEQPISAGWPAD